MNAALNEAYRHCSDVARRRAQNFFYAFITLPAPQRRGIYAVYAFCRECDDLADEPGDPAAKAGQLRAQRQRLYDAMAGRPDGRTLLALKDTVERFGIPISYFDEVIEGVEMDLTRDRYATFADLRNYCYRVASAVGLICLEIFGYTQEEPARAAAEDLGIGMQLTNILRDIKEDAGRGRIYLPGDELARFGYSEADLESGVVNEAFQELMAFQVERARDFFDRGRRLLNLVPRRSRLCPAVLHGVYSRILDRIETRGYDVFSERIEPRKREKILLTLGAWTHILYTPTVTAKRSL